MFPEYFIPNFTLAKKRIISTEYLLIKQKEIEQIITEMDPEISAEGDISQIKQEEMRVFMAGTYLLDATDHLENIFIRIRTLNPKSSNVAFAPNLQSIRDKLDYIDELQTTLNIDTITSLQYLKTIQKQSTTAIAAANQIVTLSIDLETLYPAIINKPF